MNGIYSDLIDQKQNLISFQNQIIISSFGLTSSGFYKFEIRQEEKFKTQFLKYIKSSIAPKRKENNIGLNVKTKGALNMNERDLYNNLSPQFSSAQKYIDNLENCLFGELENVDDLDLASSSKKKEDISFELPLSPNRQALPEIDLSKAEELTDKKNQTNDNYHVTNILKSQHEEEGEKDISQSFKLQKNEYIKSLEDEDEASQREEIVKLNENVAQENLNKIEQSIDFNIEQNDSDESYLAQQNQVQQVDLISPQLNPSTPTNKCQVSPTNKFQENNTTIQSIQTMQNRNENILVIINQSSPVQSEQVEYSKTNEQQNVDYRLLQSNTNEDYDQNQREDHEQNKQWQQQQLFETFEGTSTRKEEENPSQLFNIEVHDYDRKVIPNEMELNEEIIQSTYHPDFVENQIQHKFNQNQQYCQKYQLNDFSEEEQQSENTPDIKLIENTEEIHQKENVEEINLIEKAVEVQLSEDAVDVMLIENKEEFQNIEKEIDQITIENDSKISMEQLKNSSKVNESDVNSIVPEIQSATKGNQHSEELRERQQERESEEILDDNSDGSNVFDQRSESEEQNVQIRPEGDEIDQQDIKEPNKQEGFLDNNSGLNNYYSLNSSILRESQLKSETIEIDKDSIPSDSEDYQYKQRDNLGEHYVEKEQEHDVNVCLNKTDEDSSIRNSEVGWVVKVQEPSQNEQQQQFIQSDEEIQNNQQIPEAYYQEEGQATSHIEQKNTEQMASQTKQLSPNRIQRNFSQNDELEEVNSDFEDTPLKVNIFPWGGQNTKKFISNTDNFNLKYYQFLTQILMEDNQTLIFQ